MNNRIYTACDTLIGTVFIVACNDRIVAIHLGEEDFNLFEVDAVYEPKNPLLGEAHGQLEEYFQGVRRDFDLPLLQEGTDFRMSVWKELCQIPYGETRSYQYIAEVLGNPKAVRAIGQANKANPIPIIVPCHRVIGKNKSLVGYAGTRTDIKDKLLTLEGASFNE